MLNTYLYKYDTKGKVRQWRGWLETNEDGTVTIKLEHGQQNGKLQIKQRIVKSGKNLKKANSTTVYQQAEADLKSIYQKQLDDGYVASLEDYKDPVRPMLAQKYQDKKKHVVWASEEQPNNFYRASKKYDGIRCFIFIDENSNIRFESRTGKPFKYFEHIADKIKHLSNVILDGELYSNIVEFEKICSLVNSEEYDKETDTDIQFFIYDFIDLNSTDDIFEKRLEKLNKEFLKFADETQYPIQPVSQIKIKSEKDLKEFHDKWVAEGYEGLMLKDPKGLYEFGKRSNNLLKYKEMHSDEFKIKDIFIAENDPERVQIELYVDPFNSQETFKIGTLKGNKEENYSNYYLNKNNLIGKWLTINYQTLTSYGIPLFPVGIAVREGTENNNKFIPEV